MSGTHVSLNLCVLRVFTPLRTPYNLTECLWLVYMAFFLFMLHMPLKIFYRSFICFFVHGLLCGPLLRVCKRCDCYVNNIIPLDKFVFSLHFDHRKHLALSPAARYKFICLLMSAYYDFC